jgi:hypothetical protein
MLLGELQKEGDKQPPSGKYPGFIPVQDPAPHSESRGPTPFLRFDRQYGVNNMNGQNINKAE